MSDVERASGAARRRRERRLRLWLKHERQTVRMVLPETFHHSTAPFPPKFKEEWVGRHEQHHALRGQNTARTREATCCTSNTRVAGDTAFFSLYDEEDAVWRARPASLAELQGPLDRVQRRTVEQIIETFVPVQILDDPEPLMVEQLADILRILDMSSNFVQAIDMPKISQDSTPQRTDLTEPQLAEQLVEGPTVVSLSSLQQQSVEQNFDIPVGRALFIGRGGHGWCRVSGPIGVYYWRIGTPHTQWDLPLPRDTPPAQGGI